MVSASLVHPERGTVPGIKKKCAIAGIFLYLSGAATVLGVQGNTVVGGDKHDRYYFNTNYGNVSKSRGEGSSKLNVRGECSAVLRRAPKKNARRGR